jgi:hypothetical protein
MKAKVVYLCAKDALRRVLVGASVTSVCGLLLVGQSPSALAAGKANLGNPQILPPQSNPYGMSYGAWFNEYQKWWWSVTADRDPIADQTGELAALGQSGHVWFLATSSLGQSVTRTFRVPAGTALFFVPAFSVWGDYPVDDPWWYDPYTDEDGQVFSSGAAWCLADALKAVREVTDMVCVIDGKPVENLQDYICGSAGDFTGIVRNANLFGPDYVGLELVGIGAGSCLMIAPLPVGTHTLYATGTFPGFGSYEVQDTIIVTPAGK